MKSRLEKVYNKLPNQKVDLKAQKIKLGMTQDVTDLINTAYYEGERMVEEAGSSDRALEKIQDAITEYNSYLDEYDSTTDMFVFHRRLFLDSYLVLETDFYKYLDAMDELGVDVDPSLLKDMEDLNGFFSFQNNAYGDAEAGRFKEMDQFGGLK